MPLDPQIRALLDEAAQARLEPLRTLPVPLARERSAEALRAAVGAPDPVAETQDLTLPGPIGDIEATLYRPRAAHQRALLLFIHGGGWVIDSRQTHDPICRALANLSGVSILSIDYRRAPENRFPAAVDDCWAATRWTLAHASDLGLDPASVVVGGDSAGGNLAAVVARRARDAGMQLKGQLLLYPVTSARCDTPSYGAFATGYGLEAADMHWCFSLYLGDRGDVRHPDVSPLLAPDLSGLAPAAIVTAEYDVLRDEGEAYAAKLTAAGVQTVLRRATGMPHAFLNFRHSSPAVAGLYRECAQLVRYLLSGDPSAISSGGLVPVQPR